MNIRVGRASLTDKMLFACGRFYPPRATTAEARLRYYVSQFPLVEVGSTCYAMPTQLHWTPDLTDRAAQRFARGAGADGELLLPRTAG
jgi:hypothetical protein